jgi:hypothetical protein
MLWIACAIIALAVIRWCPALLAVLFCLTVIALAFGAFWLVSFV